jgi:phosphatidylethanolamine-binding protein (PEBP) family uncharacterized protein
MAFFLESSAFRRCETVPENFAREAWNLPPPLHWSGASVHNKSCVLIVEDPDGPSGTFPQWGLSDTNFRVAELPEGLAAEDPLQAINDAFHACYDRPKPQHGNGVHRFHFPVAARAVPIFLLARSNVAELWKAALPHILAETERVGTYETT